MPEIYLPIIHHDGKGSSAGQPTATPIPTETAPPNPTPSATPSATPPPGASQRIVIDPLTRIEGHLRMEVQIGAGTVQDAWSSSTMFRGIELILRGRDPREAWMLAQRVCGVCTTVHAIASVRAVEDALSLTIPDNARLIRNLLEAAQFVQDHVIHFYHLHALDWVDVVSALDADPVATGSLANSISSWPNSSPGYFAAVRDRLQAIVNSGQLGLFANGYWGHPAYALPPEGNLLAVAHYLEALDWQREFIKVHALLGGKNPHPQTYLVGGMAVPVGTGVLHGINPATIARIRVLIQQAQDFVHQVYLPDLKLVASFYPEWTNLGQGVGNFLAYGDFPDAAGGGVETYWLPQGIVYGMNLAQSPQSLDQQQIAEYITHSWYNYAQGNQTSKHPYEGETDPEYSGPQPPFDHLDTDGKYSWLKAPRYADAPMEVGPLARMAVAYAAGHAEVRTAIDDLLRELNLPAQALFSTLGRVAARGIETGLIVDKMSAWLDELEANMNNGDTAIHNSTRWNPASWPAEAVGWGTTEAPRGGLGHWIRIRNGQIENYQAVVPTTWNGSPRDANGQRGVWEQALIGTPIADPNRPLEILRTVHSFDPCMACAVHLVDAQGQPLGDGLQIQVHGV